jgi:RNA polymerase sigma-B factor
MPLNRFAYRSTPDLTEEFVRTRCSEVRREIIERHESLVGSLAQKFTRPGVPAEDLMQAAWVALIRALDRFDPGRDTQFSTYATHCMVGEIKRYFRDRTWAVRVPRYLQEVAANLRRVQDELTVRAGREPTMAEMAAAFGISEDHLAQAMELHQNYRPPSLEDRLEGVPGGEDLCVGDTVGAEDPALWSIVEHAPLYGALSTLSEREQFILRRRFYEGCSQQEVADEIGVSQMHVSRLERSALRQLRVALAHDEESSIAA